MGWRGGRITYCSVMYSCGLIDGCVVEKLVDVHKKEREKENFHLPC